MIAYHRKYATLIHVLEFPGSLRACDLEVATCKALSRTLVKVRDGHRGTHRVVIFVVAVLTIPGFPFPLCRPFPCALPGRSVLTLVALRVAVRICSATIVRFGRLSAFRLVLRGLQMWLDKTLRHKEVLAFSKCHVVGVTFLGLLVEAVVTVHRKDHMIEKATELHVSMSG